MERETWDEYFMRLAFSVASRGTCDRARVGCVFVRDKIVVISGYNGAPRGMPHCDETKHEMTDTIKNCQTAVHAEINAIAQAARVGARLDESTIYITHLPCYHCAKVLVNVGVRRVVHCIEYGIDERVPKLFDLSKIAYDHLLFPRLLEKPGRA